LVFDDIHFFSWIRPVPVQDIDEGNTILRCVTGGFTGAKLYKNLIINAVNKAKPATDPSFA